MQSNLFLLIFLPAMNFMAPWRNFQPLLYEPSIDRIDGARQKEASADFGTKVIQIKNTRHCSCGCEIDHLPPNKKPPIKESSPPATQFYFDDSISSRKKRAAKHNGRRTSKTTPTAKPEASTAAETITTQEITTTEESTSKMSPLDGSTAPEDPYLRVISLGEQKTFREKGISDLAERADVDKNPNTDSATAGPASTK